ncbi:MAG: sensor histidine kinase [Bacteroidaceae bacterium]|jgi:hypothetical protein
MNESVKTPKAGAERRRVPEIAIHIIVCITILSFPVLIMDTRHYTSGELWNAFLRFSFHPAVLLILFYINYLWLIPKKLFCEQTAEFFFWNIGFILLFSIVLRLIPMLTPPEVNETLEKIGKIDKHRRHRTPPPQWTFILRDIFSCCMPVIVAVSLRTNARWRSAENAREKAEKSRTEAELKNLKNQLSPHFLLNTLNNIYALILFDTEKAQQAVLDLSRLLRHVLYENPTSFVPLAKEAAFIQNYIDLMRIRLADHVELTTEYRISPESCMPIAPLLIISLIENAFKHGVSSDKPSFIHIRIEEKPKEGEIYCLIENSCFPKKKSDKSGSGIGLAQVRSRLELLYPGQYTWTYGPNAENTVYSSILVLHTRHIALPADSEQPTP